MGILDQIGVGYSGNYHQSTRNFYRNIRTSGRRTNRCQTTEEIATTSEQAAIGAEQMSSSIQQQTAAMQQMTSSAQNLSNIGRRTYEQHSNDLKYPHQNSVRKSKESLIYATKKKNRDCKN